MKIKYMLYKIFLNVNFENVILCVVFLVNKININRII